ncbi:MAG TPA: ASKHA domain-containing protein [Acidobacteriaceae bacterium]|nr:ASKHA domain-containing protein [Acidobacteriaceae bacterium]
MSAETVRIQLEPSGMVVEVAHGASLSSPLSLHGIEFPCGGTGLCGGCRVRVLHRSLPITQQDSLFFSGEDLASGWRLACQAIADVPLVLECEQWHMEILSDNSALSGRGKQGLGIAIDLGTTTIAAQLVDLASGNVLGVETELNPQAPFGSDVMSRIRAALSGVNLTTMVRASIGSMIARLARHREQEVAEVLLVGNSVMHHLFSRLDVEPLSHAPFHSPNLGEQRFSAAQLDWSLPPSCSIRFARCLGGFVGSDILAGIIAVGMPTSKEMIALVDLGTNGEIAIGNRERILYASTAAGPAFEAASIRMGMRASSGAISHVSNSSGEIRATVIGDQEPHGICGSGVVDAVAVGLETGAILPSGRIADGTKLFPVAGSVVLYQADIRELQLAKAAVAAGFGLLLRSLGAQPEDLKRIHLAGAFGNYIQAASAISIGLLEFSPQRIVPSGNTALRGAKMLLLSVNEPPLPTMEHIALASDADFQDEFVKCMNFPQVQQPV